MLPLREILTKPLSVKVWSFSDAMKRIAIIKACTEIDIFYGANFRQTQFQANYVFQLACKEASLKKGIVIKVRNINEM